jgi:hypothetical protein
MGEDKGNNYLSQLHLVHGLPKYEQVKKKKLIKKKRVPRTLVASASVSNIRGQKFKGRSISPLCTVKRDLNCVSSAERENWRYKN